MKLILNKKEIAEKFGFDPSVEIVISDEPVSVGVNLAEVTKNPKVFFKDLFNIDVENPVQKEGHISLPMPKGLTCDQIYKVMETKFSCWKWCDSIDAVIKEQQKRPDSYVFTFKDSIEPDIEHRNKSYNDFKDDGNTYMIPKEGMLAYLYVFWLRGDKLDVIGLTRLHALDSGGYAMGMYRHSNGRFYINGLGRGYRDTGIGPRQICF